MSDPIRYGVFKLGQIWCVRGTAKEWFGYMSREEAVSAVNAIAGERRAAGIPCEVVIQDDNGRLRSLGSFDALGAAVS